MRISDEKKIFFHIVIMIYSNYLERHAISLRQNEKPMNKIILHLRLRGKLKVIKEIEYKRRGKDIHKFTWTSPHGKTIKLSIWTLSASCFLQYIFSCGQYSLYSVHFKLTIITHPEPEGVLVMKKKTYHQVILAVGLVFELGYLKLA